MEHDQMELELPREPLAACDSHAIARNNIPFA
jgi:hypothetical protein